MRIGIHRRVIYPDDYLKLNRFVAVETKAAPDKTDQRRVVVGVVSEAEPMILVVVEDTTPHPKA